MTYDTEQISIGGWNETNLGTHCSYCCTTSIGRNRLYYDQSRWVSEVDDQSTIELENLLLLWIRKTLECSELPHAGGGSRHGWRCTVGEHDGTGCSHELLPRFRNQRRAISRDDGEHLSAGGEYLVAWCCGGRAMGRSGRRSLGACLIPCEESEGCLQGTECSSREESRNTEGSSACRLSRT